jgi:hypothetical protein
MVAHHGHSTRDAAAGTSNSRPHVWRLHLKPIRRSRHPDTRHGRVGRDLVANCPGWACPHSSHTASGGDAITSRGPILIMPLSLGVRGHLTATVASQVPHRERRRVTHVVDELPHEHACERPNGRLGLLGAGRLHHGHHQTAPTRAEPTCPGSGVERRHVPLLPFRNGLPFRRSARPCSARKPNVPLPPAAVEAEGTGSGGGAASP